LNNGFSLITSLSFSIKIYNFDLFLFDTAPSGDTLRLLNLARILEKGIDREAYIPEIWVWLHKKIEA